MSGVFRQAQYDLEERQKHEEDYLDKKMADIRACLTEMLKQVPARLEENNIIRIDFKKKR